MQGGKNNALQRAYLAGLQAQTSVYGATIPVIYGCTRTSPLLIWANNLREGAGLGAAKKSSSLGGPPNFVENVDFLIGHNPIAGVLQLWYNNNTAPFSLNFAKLSTAITYPAIEANGYVTIADPDYYFVVAVTADVALSAAFNDYGGPGAETPSGTFEMPLWNLNYAGPDPTNQNGYRQWPACYQWIPYSGPTVNFPGGTVSGIPGYAGTVHIYYAKKASNRGGGIPIGAARLAFEPVLGSGTEYAPNPSQQIIYPQYAGAYSGNLDMGVSGVAPALNFETVGMFSGLPPSGDADYADMIEDIFKSGPAQAGTGAAVGYGDIHHGLGCCDFPGCIQKKVIYGGVEPALSVFSFDLPNTAGNFLFCFVHESNFGGGSTIGISDSAGNTWTPLLTVGATSVQLWYCVAKASSPGTTITLTNYDRYMSVTLLEIGGLDTIDGSPVVVNQTTGGAFSGSVTTTNKPGENALLLSFVEFQPGSGGMTDAPFHWSRIIGDIDPTPNMAVDEYATKFPGTYTVSYPSFGVSSLWTGVLIALKNSQPNSFTSPLGNILDDATMQQTRLQCRAYGLNGSMVMDSQKKASDWLTELYRVANSAPVWSGFSLKSIPYAEASTIGNGAIYTSPTASGPVADLTENDFATQGNDPPVIVTRTAQVDAPNLQQIQSPGRDSYYNHVVTSQPDNGSMSLYGTRKDSPKVFMSIQTEAVARMILGIMVRETNIIRNIYTFTLKANWALLEAMDLITVPIQSTMPALNPVMPVSGTIALRLTSVSIDENFGVQCEAEPFIYGLRTPFLFPVATPTPYVPGFDADPGNVNAPIIFEAVPMLTGVTNPRQLWLVVSAPSTNYGGCVAYISTDGGASYKPLGPNNGIINGNATTGITLGVWPANADPDTANDLQVVLTESRGNLESYQVVDEDNFTYPCYVAGGGGNPIPYELMAYALANLASVNVYFLKATGGGTNHLRRAVFGAPTVGFGVSHPSGSRFAFLDPNNPNAAGILRVPIDPSWIGLTLWFKFTAFNTLGGGMQDLASVTAYSYAVTGLVPAVNPAGIPSQLFLINGTGGSTPITEVPLAPGASGPFTVAHGMPAIPAFVIVQMTSAGAIWLQSPTGFDATNVYLVASAPGVTGNVIAFTAAADAAVVLAPGAPGNFSVAHGLGVTPALALVQMYSGGAIWFQSPTGWDGTNIYLDASAAGIIGTVYVWKSVPTPTVFASLPLAPAAPGSFTIAHGLGKIPTLVLVRMKSGGAIWIDSTPADATNVYLVASAAGVLGEVEVWIN